MANQTSQVYSSLPTHPRHSSIVKQPTYSDDTPFSPIENLPTDTGNNTLISPEKSVTVGWTRAKKHWKRALYKLRSKKAVERVNAGILNFGTNELTDGTGKYKGNLDELLERKVEKRERFRSIEAEKRHGNLSQKWLFYPKSVFKEIWTASMTLVMIYVAIMSPYRLAFMEDVFFDGLTTTDLTLNGLFIADMLINFNSAYTKSDGSIEDRRWYIARNYLASWFLIDLISSIPFNLIELLIDTNNSGGTGYNSAMRLARLPRLYRLFRLAKVFKALGHYSHTAYMEKVQDCVQINSRLVKLTKFLIIVFFCVHFMGCLWFFSARLSDFEPDSWVVRCGFLDESTGYQYLAAIYWTVTTTVTVGYGDITARTQLEMVLAIVWMFIGVGFYSFTVGSLSSFLTSIDTRDSLLTTKMAALQEFAKETCISSDVKARIRDAVRYYTWKMGSVWSDKHSLFNEIPRALQYEVAVSMYGGVIKDLQFFNGKGRSFILYFMPIFKPVKFKNCDYLYKEGEYADEVFFISKGRVNLVLFPREIAYKSYLRGSYIGEIELVKAIKRIDNAQVFGDSEFLAVGKEDFLAALEEFPVEAKDIHQMAAERYKRHRQAMLETVELLKLKKQRGSLADIAGRERVLTVQEIPVEAECTAEECMRK
jgi:CRP-like cAMP-binding protein